MWMMLSVKDKRANEFGVIYLARNRETGIRMLVDAMSAGNTILTMHPADFALYTVGDFDEDSGRCHELTAGAEFIVDVVDLLSTPKEV